MRKTHKPFLRSLPLLLLTSLALLWPGKLQSQPAGSLVLVGLDPISGALVPVDLEVARRPGELRLDPRTGTLSAEGTMPAPSGTPAFLAYDLSTGALVPVDVQPVRRAGQINLDPRTGELTPEGLMPSSPASGGPTLVGFEPGTRTLAPVGIGLVRKPGSYTFDFQAGIVSPAPSSHALLAFETESRRMVPVELVLVRGRGALVVDPGTGRLSPISEGPNEGATLTLLSVRPDVGALIPVNLDLVSRPGVLAIDRSTGKLSPTGEGAAPGRREDLLTILGVQSPTGALTRTDVEPARTPGEYAVDLSSGALEQVRAPSPAGKRDGFIFGAGLDVRQMLKLGDVLEEVDSGASGHDATTVTPGIHGIAEYRWRAISFGLEAGYSKMETEVRFPQGLQTGDLSYMEIGGSVKIALPLDAPISPYVTFAILRTWTEADFEIEGLTEQRTHKTKRDGIGAGFDYWGSPHWGLRVEGLYSTTFQDGDAFDHIRWRLGAMYSPGGIRVGRYGD